MIDSPLVNIPMPAFMPGLRLSELFYKEAVRPILAAWFPQITYSAGRLDSGSDVLGFDTPQSMDHGWGPQLTLYVTEADYAQYQERIVAVLGEQLPYEIHGFPTNFASSEDGSEYMLATDKRPIRHRVTVTTIPRFFEGYVGFNPTHPISEIDWLTTPQQRLRAITSGKAFYDGLDRLEAMRGTLKWYPRDVWLHLMANQWQRIDQEEPFMARCGDVGDELGSRIVGTRLVNDLMRLCFLIERQYTPYIKWFGTAFARLACAEKLAPIFHRVLDSLTWKDREKHLSAAYIIVAQMHNSLGVTPPIEGRVAPFFDRPYLVPHSGRFTKALHKAIQSEAIRSLPRHVGGVDQFVDSTDVLSNIQRCKALAAIYG